MYTNNRLILIIGSDKGEWLHFRGYNSTKNDSWLPSQKMSTLKGKNLQLDSDKEKSQSVELYNRELIFQLQYSCICIRCEY